MKGFTRENLLLSLCGLNCGLCVMHLGGHCPGCGGGEGNQSCAIARCSLEHGNAEYCSQCGEYPCTRYAHSDDCDSFITHQNRRRDLEKVLEIGTEAYNEEQLEKIRTLHFLLEHYNDGRKKTLFATAVNLLELAELQGVVTQLSENAALQTATQKEKAAAAAKALEEIAAERGTSLKLRKK